MQRELLVEAEPFVLRNAARIGEWSDLTTGLCLRFVQANLAVVPGYAASDFHEFCLANPSAMPLLDIVEAGSVEPSRVAPGADLRLDLPRYRVFRDGELVAEPTDVVGYWRDDLVSFLIGCSFSTEAALLKAGVPLRNLERHQNEPVFRTSVKCVAVGRFHAPLVVSMRPIPQDLVEVARQISARYPLAHGGPVHVGDPELIGIRDLARPEWGAPMNSLPGDVPMFWACGVTPQAAIIDAGLDLAITHAPGHMFVTDIRDEEICDIETLSPLR